MVECCYCPNLKLANPLKIIRPKTLVRWAADRGCNGAAPFARRSLFEFIGLKTTQLARALGEIFVHASIGERRLI
jgi:hypothetical protein